LLSLPRDSYRKRYFTLDGDTVSDRMLSFPRVFGMSPAISLLRDKPRA
jgi:hypothetical protein